MEHNSLIQAMQGLFERSLMSSFGHCHIPREQAVIAKQHHLTQCNTSKLVKQTHLDPLPCCCYVQLNSRWISYHISFQLIGNEELALPCTSWSLYIWTEFGITRLPHSTFWKWTCPLNPITLMGGKEYFSILLYRLPAKFYSTAWNLTATKLTGEKSLEPMIFLLLLLENITNLAKLFHGKTSIWMGDLPCKPNSTWQRRWRHTSSMLTWWFALCQTSAPLVTVRDMLAKKIWLLDEGKTKNTVQTPYLVSNLIK